MRLESSSRRSDKDYPTNGVMLQNRILVVGYRETNIGDKIVDKIYNYDAWGWTIHYSNGQICMNRGSFEDAIQEVIRDMLFDMLWYPLV